MPLSLIDSGYKGLTVIAAVGPFKKEIIMAGFTDFIMGRGALKSAIAASESEEEKKKKKKLVGGSPASVPVNASDAANIAAQKLKQESLKKVVKSRSKGSYK